MYRSGTLRDVGRGFASRGLGRLEGCVITDNGARVCSDDGPPPPLPAPSTFQQLSLDKRKHVLREARSYFNPSLSLFRAPTDSRPVVVTSPTGTAAQPFVAYPAPGAGPKDVITPFKVDPGLLLVINFMAIIHVGGNPPDGNGNVVWRVLINGNGVKGLNNLNAELGTYAAPNEFVLALVENDTIQITVEVPAAQPAMPAGQATAARFHAWTYPIVKGLSK